MTYALQRLAPGSYDLVLGGEVVGSVVREVRDGTSGDVWHAELLDDPAPEKRPPPFSEIDHTFGTLNAVVVWLGGAGICPERRRCAGVKMSACQDIINHSDRVTDAHPHRFRVCGLA